MDTPQPPPNLPRGKRLKRASRLQAAQAWLPQYRGKNVVRGYRRHFGVDLLCAIAELQMLGVEISPEYIAAVKAPLAEKQRQKEERSRQIAAPHSECCDGRFAFIAGYTSGGAPHGLTWEELEEERPDRSAD